MMNDPENNDTLKDALKAYGLKQDIRRIHNEMMPVLKKKAPVRSLFSYANRIAAAILVFILATGIIVYFTSTPANLFNNKYEPYEESAQRGNSPAASEIKNKFTQAQTYLRTGDTEKAILTFAEILYINSRSQQKILNDDAEYYLALAYLKADQPANAIPVFQKIHDNKNHLYNDEVTDWYLLKVKISAWKEK